MVSWRRLCLLPPANEVWGKAMFYSRVSFCSQERGCLGVASRETASRGICLGGGLHWGSAWGVSASRGGWGDPPPKIHGILWDTINKQAVHILLECFLAFITSRNEVVAKVMLLQVSVIHSVHRGGLPQCMLGYHPPPRPGRPPRTRQTPQDQGDTPQTRQTPQTRENPPAGRTPPPGPRRTPPEEDCSIWSMSGRYASYWNAFLLTCLIAHIDRTC